MASGIRDRRHGMASEHGSGTGANKATPPASTVPPTLSRKATSPPTPSTTSSNTPSSPRHHPQKRVGHGPHPPAGSPRRARHPVERAGPRPSAPSGLKIPPSSPWTPAASPFSRAASSPAKACSIPSTQEKSACSATPPTRPSASRSPTAKTAHPPPRRHP